LQHRMYCSVKSEPSVPLQYHQPESLLIPLPSELPAFLHSCIPAFRYFHLMWKGWAYGGTLQRICGCFRGSGPNRMTVNHGEIRMTTFCMLTARTSKVNFQIWPVSARNKSMNNYFIASQLSESHQDACGSEISQYYSDGLTNRQATHVQSYCLPFRHHPGLRFSIIL
jgi:hypothetical protein